MIAWLKGKIIHKDQNSLVLKVNSIGYQVFAGQRFLQELRVDEEKEVELVIYQLVKEDELKLFGFRSFKEKTLFLILLTVSGVGPKVALSVLDQISIPKIVEAVIYNNFKVFEAVSGVGKKTAQRIIVDLQEKVREYQKNQLLTPDLSQGPQPDNLEDTQNNVLNDARSALQNLGFPAQQAEKMLQRFYQANIALDELLKKCLSKVTKEK